MVERSRISIKQGAARYLHRICAYVRVESSTHSDNERFCRASEHQGKSKKQYDYEELAGWCSWKDGCIERFDNHITLFNFLNSTTYSMFLRLTDLLRNGFKRNVENMVFLLLHWPQALGLSQLMIQSACEGLGQLSVSSLLSLAIFSPTPRVSYPS